MKLARCGHEIELGIDLEHRSPRQVAWTSMEAACNDRHVFHGPNTVCADDEDELTGCVV